jgi:F-box interacting protein
MPKSPIMNLMMKFGFGYDSFTNIYKVVVVLLYTNRYVKKTEVKVYTLGTDFWRSILDFPFGAFPIDYSGRFVSGRINWLASTTGYEQNPFIVSLDLANESYQQFLLPDYGEVDEDNFLTLHVLRDCLCIIFGHDVWIMKEYGNKESWTKLFTVSYMRDPSKSYVLTKAIYIFDDDHQLLLESIAHEHWGRKFIVYNSRNNTFNFTKFILNENSFNLWSRAPEVCVESLTLPWS